MSWFFFHLLLFALLTWIGVSAQFKIRLAEIMNLKEYDGALRPQRRQGPTMVNVSLVMHSLIIDDKMQILQLSGELHQDWDDPGLGFPGTSGGIPISSVGLSRTSGKYISEKLWRPDLTSAQELNPQIQNPQDDFLRISQGHLSWIQRVHYNFPCSLNLKGYPLGSHHCVLKLQSLGFDANELEPSWQGDAAVDYGSVMLTHGYQIEEIKTSAKTVVTVHRTKRQLRVEMEIHSTSGWAMKHTVIPMSMTVITAYLAFFINIRGVAARMMTCMLSLVTAAIFHEGSYRSVPPASYTMALEVFTGTCLTFIYIATVESVVVDILSHLPTKGRRSTPSPHTSFALEPDLTEERPGTRGQVAAQWLDRCFRVLYPAAFLAFNAVYWVLYN